MKKLLFVLLTALSAQVASAVSEIVVTFNPTAQVITFDFSGMEEGAYINSTTNGVGGYFYFGVDSGLYHEPSLISNTLVDRFDNPVPDEAVNKLIRVTEGNRSNNPLLGVGFGNITGIHSFTISGGTVSFSTDGFLPSLVVDYMQNFPLNTIARGNFVGSGGFTVIGVTAVPEPSAFAALAGFGALALVATRRRRA